QDVLEGTRRSRFAPPIARRTTKPGTPPAAPAIEPDAPASTGGAADGAAGDEGAGA
ncbi:PFL_4669 family integrating conjugative element protein, partial [Pseudomonas aeruginosa]|nr:TIGR03761 family integrating conjugative element protein [Pseudomonas aeruginosa]